MRPDILLPVQKPSKICFSITEALLESYKPNAIVLQCGADGLTGDKLGGFNLTLQSFGYCVGKVLSWKKPTLVLGGGIRFVYFFFFIFKLYIYFFKHH